WALLLVPTASGSWWSWTLLALALSARLWVALDVGVRTLRDRQVLQDWWLLPFRDLLGVALWLWSYASNTVTWKGEKFRLAGGRMHHLKNVANAKMVKSRHSANF